MRLSIGIKLAIMAMAMVVAVASLGVGYGIWNQTISVEAIIVNNGTFDPTWIDTFTNDDGTIDDAAKDPGDNGGGTNFDGIWGAASSNDPSAAGPNAPRYDKDVARCLASSPIDTTGDGEKDSFRVMIENGYPSYTCTFWGVMQNQGLSPEKVRSVDIDFGFIYGDRDGSSTAGSAVFTTTTFDFRAHNIQAGYMLTILSGHLEVPTSHTIASVDGPNQVTLTANLSQTATGIHFRVGPASQDPTALTVAELLPTVAGQTLVNLGDILTAAFWVHVEQTAEQNFTYYFTIRMPIDVIVSEITTGTIGFWCNWDSHNTYTQAEIETWLAQIDDESQWLGPRDIEGFENLVCEKQGHAFLLIDEESIGESRHFDSTPTAGHFGQDITPATPKFQAADVNVGSPTQRNVLPYFAGNIGEEITVLTGQTGDEGWFAPNDIPESWSTSGTPEEGIANFLAGTIPQSQLDKIPDVRPLRALGEHSLEGHTVCAVVYKSDVNVNYNSKKPRLDANLQGDTIGIVAFTVLVDGVHKVDGFSSSTLPEAQIRIEDASEVCSAPLDLFNVPIPKSSSVPNDIDPYNPPPNSSYIFDNTQKSRLGRFLAHYLALRLNELSGRIPGSSQHDTTSVDPGNYLGLPGGPGLYTLDDIIAAIEAKFGTFPTPAEFEIMKDVADGINNNVL